MYGMHSSKTLWSCDPMIHWGVWECWYISIKKLIKKLQKNLLLWTLILFFFEKFIISYDFSTNSVRSAFFPAFLVVCIYPEKDLGGYKNAHWSLILIKKIHRENFCESSPNFIFENINAYCK